MQLGKLRLIWFLKINPPETEIYFVSPVSCPLPFDLNRHSGSSHTLKSKDAFWGNFTMVVDNSS
jgi:hypothetical protein